MRISLLFVTICFIICSIVSCTDELVRTCAAGAFTTNIKNENLSHGQFRPFDFTTNDQTIYYEYFDSSRVRFKIGRTISNICPFKNVRVSYSALTSENDQPKLFNMIGEISWNTFSSGFGSELLIVNDTILPNFLYQSSDEYDFNGDFGDKMAVVDIFIGIEFNQLNSFQEDSTYFVDHIQNLQIVAEGDLFR